MLALQQYILEIERSTQPMQAIETLQMMFLTFVDLPNAALYDVEKVTLLNHAAFCYLGEYNMVNE